MTSDQRPARGNRWLTARASTTSTSDATGPLVVRLQYRRQHSTEDPNDVRADATQSLLRDRLVHVEAFRGWPSSKHRRLNKNVLKHRILHAKRLCSRLPNSLARQKRRSLLFAFALAFRPPLCPPAPALLPNYAPRPRIVAVPAKHKAIPTTTTSISCRPFRKCRPWLLPRPVPPSTHVILDPRPKVLPHDCLPPRHPPCTPLLPMPAPLFRNP